MSPLLADLLGFLLGCLLAWVAMVLVALVLCWLETGWRWLRSRPPVLGRSGHARSEGLLATLVLILLALLLLVGFGRALLALLPGNPFDRILP